MCSANHLLHNAFHSKQSEESCRVHKAVHYALLKCAKQCTTKLNILRRLSNKAINAMFGEYLCDTHSVLCGSNWVLYILMRGIWCSMFYVVTLSIYKETFHTPPFYNTTRKENS